MKIKELRDSVKEKDSKVLENILVEVYKLLPKDKKEDADVLIADILSGKGKQKKEKSDIVNYPELLTEIDYFIQCAKQGYYFAPNRVISKSERPKWRFKVKGFIKQLLACSIENPCYPKAVSALTSLYELICQSCGVYIFRSEVPFQSLGIDQDDLYAAVVEKIISLGVNEEIMRKLILLAVNVDLSYDCLHEQLIDRLLSILNTEEQRKDLLSIAISMRKEQYQKLKSYKTKYEIPYEERSLLEELNKITFIISAIFGITQNDIDEFFKYSQDRAEVSLYCMLNYISIFGVDEDWIDVYRYAITKIKIEPRDYLKNKYQELLKELA